MTPPPKARIRSSRSTLRSSSRSSSPASALMLLVASPGGKITGSLSMPAAARPCRKAGRCSAATVSSVTIATKGRGSSGRINSPDLASRPPPIRIS